MPPDVCDHCIPEKYEGIVGLCRVVEHEELDYVLRCFVDDAGSILNIPVSHCLWCGHEYEENDFLGGRILLASEINMNLARELEIKMDDCGDHILSDDPLLRILRKKGRVSDA